VQSSFARHAWACVLQPPLAYGSWSRVLAYRQRLPSARSQVRRPGRGDRLLHQTGLAQATRLGNGCLFTLLVTSRQLHPAGDR
jgi:hypothetical protein